MYQDKYQYDIGKPSHFLDSLTTKLVWFSLKITKTDEEMKKTAAKNELVPQFWTYDKFDYRYRKTIKIRKNCCKYFSHFPSVVARIEL